MGWTELWHYEFRQLWPCHAHRFSGELFCNISYSSSIVRAFLLIRTSTLNPHFLHVKLVFSVLDNGRLDNRSVLGMKSFDLELFSTYANVKLSSGKRRCGKFVAVDIFFHINRHWIVLRTELGARGSQWVCHKSDKIRTSVQEKSVNCSPKIGLGLLFAGCFPRSARKLAREGRIELLWRSRSSKLKSKVTSIGSPKGKTS